MFEPAQLALFCAAVFVLALTPGPDIIYVLTRGLSQGRKAAVFAAIGFNLGIIVHTLAAALGISALLRASALAFGLVKWAGAAYLIYIGIKTLRDRSGFAAGRSAPISSGRILRETIVANVLNPKVALFFLAFLPQFGNADHGSPALQMVLLGLLFMGVSFPVFCLVALFSGVIGDRLRSNPRYSDWLRRAAGTVLVGLGLRLALLED